MIKILCVLDVVGVGDWSVEQEFEALKKRILKYIGEDKRIKFELRTDFYELPSYDALIVDYGGLGIMSETLSEDWSRSFIKELENKPNRIFWVKSAFAETAIKELLQDEILEEYVGVNLFFDYDEFIDALKLKCREVKNA